jgi:hypothetical protein
VKTRRETRSRPIPHTIEGTTYPVPDEYDITIPVPPRDWDLVTSHVVNTFTVIAIIASVAWTTTSIGDLLNRTAPAFAAYCAAAVFDLTWITCMAVEWMARHNRQKAALPRWGGHIALLIAMTAVTYHGKLTDSLATGIIGAFISLLAKGLWTIVIHHHDLRLDKKTQAWVDQRAQEVGAREVLAHLQRREARTREELAAYAALQAASRAASQAPAYTVTRNATGRPAQRVTPDEADVIPADDSMKTQLTGMKNEMKTPQGVNKKNAILAASLTLPPDAAPAEIARLLTEQGIEVSTKYVYTVLHREQAKKRTDGPDHGYDTGGYL